jgi:phosphoglycolate phosphatase
MTLAQAILFDLDGTLIDSRGDIAAACNHALALQGREPLPIEVVKGFVGDGARALLARAFARSIDDPLLDRALGDFRAYYEANPTTHTTLLPGAAALLAPGSLGSLPFGLVTNKSRSTTEIVLARLGLRTRFGAVRGGGDGPLKPDPWLALDALRELGVAPAVAWFVGDGPQDILAGRAAGCFTIAVRNGLADADAVVRAKPDRIVDALDELDELVREPTGRLQPGP